MKLGYIGLGALGSELARRFLPTHELWVWDINAAASERMGKVGARVAASAAQIAREVDTVFICLPRSSDVRQMIFGPNGLAQGLSAGKLIIDQTSGIPQETLRMARDLAALGVEMIDAAVSGSPQVVAKGLTTLMVSGPDGPYERALPLLHVITDTIHRCGTRVGDGQAMKMVNNAMNAGTRMGTLEMVALGRKAGISLECMTAALNNGGGGNITTERMLPAIARGQSATNFALSLMLKDLNQAVTLGMDVGVPMLISSAVRSLLQIGANTLGDSAQLEAMIGVIESMAAKTLAHQDPAQPEAEPSRPLETRDLKVGCVVGGDAGTALAQRLLRSREVLLYPNDPESLRRCRSEQTAIAPDLASLARDSDVLMLFLSSSQAVPDLLFGDRGLIKGLSAGKVIIDHTASDPEHTHLSAARLRELDVTLLDAPVLGSPAEVAGGSFLLLASGALPAYGNVESLLHSLTSEIIYCGAVGNAQVTRVVTNTVAALCRLITYECVAAGRKFGLSLKDMSWILPKSSGWSAASRELLPLLASGGLIHGPTISSVVRDLRLTARLAMTHGAPTTILNSVRGLFEAALNEYGEAAGIGQMTGLFEKISGMKFT